MPYVMQANRYRLKPALSELKQTLAEGMFSWGEFAYVLADLADFMTGKNAGYAQMSHVRGVMQDAVDEYYRRVMAPYEDAKKEQSGDVYGVNQ